MTQQRHIYRISHVLDTKHQAQFVGMHVLHAYLTPKVDVLHNIHTNAEWCMCAV